MSWHWSVSEGFSGPSLPCVPPLLSAFKKLENDIEGRKSLALLQKIIGELQRLESRRVKLGLKIAWSIPNDFKT